MSQSSETLSHSINFEVLKDIQEEIDPGDMISLMFLLYEDPHTALKKLSIYQRMAADIGVVSSNLLVEWAVHARPTWKWELLEALLTCQLYTVIRKLGFHKPTVTKEFQKGKEISHYINPLRKIFYIVCENLNNPSYRCFKQILRSDRNINVSDHEVCEILFLELICKRFFIPVTSTRVPEFNENIQKLLEILRKVPGCNSLYSELSTTCNITTNTSSDLGIENLHIGPTTSNMTRVNQGCRIYEVQDFEDEFQQFNEISLQNLSLESLKSDDSVSHTAHGLCYIINQENFSSENQRSNNFLVDRPESAADKILLKETMKNHSIEVITDDNLSRVKMFENIKTMLKNYVKLNHRLFLLCILSHGTRDHVYSANSERVSIYDIENLFDSDEFVHLRKVPKVLILQACQADESILLADSSKHYIKKSNMITFCSTAPGYKAFRVRGKGSIFIHRLCMNIQKHSNEQHLTDIFTKVIEEVSRLCSGYDEEQLPIILRNTLMTKIHLKKIHS